MKKPAKPLPAPSAPTQAQSRAPGSGRAFTPFIPTALMTSPLGSRRASTVKRTLIGGNLA